MTKVILLLLYVQSNLLDEDISYAVAIDTFSSLEECEMLKLWREAQPGRDENSIYACVKVDFGGTVQ